MPPPEGRAGDICIWIVSCLFFLVILAGGVFLALYIVLPESEETIWFPIVGMVLVGIPWLFWIMTCIYRSVTSRKVGGAEQAPTRVASITPATCGATATTTTSITSDSPVNSPGGARRVRFGVATVMGSQEAAGGAAGLNGKKPDQEGDGDSHATNASSNVSTDDGSSLNSHESEVPLAFSMS